MSAQKEIDFTLLEHISTNWCWAVAAASIANYYQPGSFTPCKVASGCFPGKNCCPDSSNNPCDQQNTMENAFSVTHNQLGGTSSGGMGLGDISAQIDNGRPITVGIQQSDNNGHFIIIYGYHLDDNGNTTLNIADPEAGVLTIPLNEVTSAYRGGGRWQFSYLTQPQNSGFVPKFIQQSSNLLFQAMRLEMPATNFAPTISFPFPKLTHENLAVEIYIISFDSLRKNKKTALNLYGRRRMEADADGHFYIVDYDHRLSENSLRMLTGDPRYLAAYRSAMAQTIRPHDKLKNSYTLRIISQPALKLEAFWLHRESAPGEDRFLLIRSNAFLKQQVWYSRRTLFTILRNQARKAIRPNTGPLIGG